jgi:hypothetical protein
MAKYVRVSDEAMDRIKSLKVKMQAQSLASSISFGDVVAAALIALEKSVQE